jgi:hypothetical protein
MSGERCGVTWAIANPVPKASTAKEIKRLVIFTAQIVGGLVARAKRKARQGKAAQPYGSG